MGETLEWLKTREDVKRYLYAQILNGASAEIYLQTQDYNTDDSKYIMEEACEFALELAEQAVKTLYESNTNTGN